MNKLLFGILAAFVCSQIAFGMVETVYPPYFPTVDQMDSQGFDSDYFTIASSLIYAINRGRANPSWMSGLVTNNFSSFSDDDILELQLSYTDYYSFNADYTYYDTIEGWNATNASVAFFNNLTAQTQFTINTGLMWSAQTRANYLVNWMWTNDSDYAIYNNNAAALGNLSVIGNTNSLSSFNEYVIYSCDSVGYSFFPLWYQLFTSDGDTTRYVRNGVYSNPNTQFGIGIASLQTSVYPYNTSSSYCSSGSALVVIHIADSFTCTNTCPLIPYPVTYYSSDDATNNPQKATEWTNYWQWFWGNYTNAGAPWVTLNITWNFTSLSLGFNANLMGSTLGVSLPSGSYVWEVTDYSSSNSNQDLAWFLTNIWNQYSTSYAQLYIPTYQITQVTRIGVNVKFVTSTGYIYNATTSVDFYLDSTTRGNAVNCGNQCFPAVGPATPHYFDATNDFDNCFRGISPASSCVSTINEAFGDLSGTVMFDCMFMYNMLQTARQTPANVSNLTQGAVTFNSNFMNINISQVPFPVTVNTSAGQTSWSNFLTFASSRASDQGVTINYPLTISAQTRANMIASNSVYGAATPNLTAVQTMLNDLTALNNSKASFAEVLIFTCDTNLLSEVFDVPFKALTSDGDSTKFSQNTLFNTSYDSIGIGMAYWNYSTTNQCYPKITVIHVGTHIQCINQTCPSEVPAPVTGNFDLSIYTVNFDGWNFMWQQIIQNNQNYYAGVNIIWEINEELVDQLKLKAVFVETANVAIANGTYSWTISNVVTTNGTYITGLQFWYYLLWAAGINETATLSMSELNFPTWALENIYSFDIYLDWWNSSNFTVKTIQPAVVQLLTLNLPNTYPTDLYLSIVSSEGSYPHYSNLIMTASTYYPNPTFTWTVEGTANQGVLTGVATNQSYITIPVKNFLWGQTVNFICTYTSVNLTSPANTVGGSYNQSITFYSLNNPTFNVTNNGSTVFVSYSGWDYYNDDSDNFVQISSDPTAAGFYSLILDYSDFSDNQATFPTPLVAQSVQFTATFMKQTYPDFQIPTNFSVAPQTNLSNYTVNISTMPNSDTQLYTEASTFLNIIGAKKIANGGAFVSPASVNTTGCPAGCKGTCTEVSNVAAWSIQKYYCACPSGYGGALCDLATADIATFTSGLTNVTQAANYLVKYAGYSQQQFITNNVLVFLNNLASHAAIIGALDSNTINSFVSAVINISSYTTAPPAYANAINALVSIWNTGGQPFPSSLTQNQLTSLSAVANLTKSYIYQISPSTFNAFNQLNSSNFANTLTYMNSLTVFSIAKGLVPVAMTNTLTYGSDGSATGYININQVPSNVASVYLPTNMVATSSNSPVVSITQFSPTVYSAWAGSSPLLSNVYDVSLYDTYGNPQTIPAGVLSANNPIIINIPVLSSNIYTVDNTTYSCIYFNTTTSSFASDGCITAPTSNGYVSCECTHLTQFALTGNATAGGPNSASILTMSFGMLILLALAILL